MVVAAAVVFADDDVDVVVFAVDVVVAAGDVPAICFCCC